MRSLSLIIRFLLAIPFFASEVSRADDEDFSKVVFKATPLTSSVHMLEGAGGNITALVGSEGTLLVDDDFAPMADKLLAKLRELGGDSPRFIVNTHFHYDHTGGNEVFGRSATIIGAKTLRERLKTEQTLWKELHPPAAPQALPTVTFESTLTLHLNGEEVRVLHLPHGHTDGDAVVFFENAKVASLGDLYFSGMYPIFHPEHDGSLEGYAKNIALVLKQIPPGARVVPGHGPLSTKAELARYHAMILASIKLVKKAKRAGQSMEQVLKAGMPAEWEPFSHGYLSTDKWLALVYKNIR